MIPSQYFKTPKIANRAKYLHPTVANILAEMLQWIEVHFGFTPVVTETVTTEAEDRALGRRSATHREARAFDIRTMGWTSAQIQTFMEEFNNKYKILGAISARTGEPIMLLHHNAGTGPHFHVQFAKKFAIQDLPTNLDVDEGIIPDIAENEIPEGPWEAIQPNPKVSQFWYVKREGLPLAKAEIAIVFGNERVAKLLAAAPDLLSASIVGHALAESLGETHKHTAIRIQQAITKAGGISETKG